MTSARDFARGVNPNHPATTIRKPDHPDQQLDQMIAWEQGDLDVNETVDLFQNLIDTGLAWSLQGAYGRQAMALIDAGLCDYPKGQRP